MRDEAALLAALRAGDAAALETLARTHGDPLIRYAARFVESPDRAREVVQDIFLDLWRNRESLAITNGVVAYLFWRTRNHALHVAHADRATRAREAKWLAESEIQFGSSVAISDETFEAGDLRGAVWHVLQTVQPRAREIFMLVWDEQLSPAQVATILGLSPATVRSQLSRTLQHLIRTLGQEWRER